MPVQSLVNLGLEEKVEEYKEAFTPSFASLDFINSKVKSIPLISKLRVEDRDHFNNLFWKNEKSLNYGNCWSYIEQGTFFGGWKYYDGKTAVVFTTRFPGMWPFVIVKGTGKNYLEKIVELARVLKNSSLEKVIVKNLSDAEFNFLKKRGFADYALGDSWSSRFKYDDDTFPEAIVTIQNALNLKGGKFKHVKYRMNHLKKKHRVLIEEFKPILFHDAMAIWKKWTDSFMQRFEKDLATNPLDAHSIDLHKQFISSLYSWHNGKSIFSNILYLDGEPHGFALAEKISNETIGVYSNISSNEFQGISEYLLYSIFTSASQAGFKYANLGGSEFKSLFNFKKKFFPILVQKRHAVLY